MMCSKFHDQKVLRSKLFSYEMQVIMDFSNRAVKVPNLAIDYAETPVIYKLGFNQNHYTFDLI